jgi:hypothetical protein
MPLPGKGMLRRVLPTPLPKHTEERLKLMAGGLQNIALAVVVGAFLTPLLNPAFAISLGGKVLAGVTAGIAELLALYLLGLIPTSENP